MKQFFTIIFAIAFISSSLNAQKLLRPFESISGAKPSYLYMENGEEIEGKIKKLKYKKGLIKSVKITVDGEKREIPIEDIKYAYFPQSGLDKFIKAADVANDATQWNGDKYNQDRVKDGYAIFEKQEVMVKKKKRILLMQLLNPGTCSRVKVFHDPTATETAGVGLAGVRLTGGEDKSYYISKDGETAVKIQKRKYKKMFNDLYGDCKTITRKYKSIKWKDFVDTVFAYNKKCAKQESIPRQDDLNCLYPASG